MTTLFADLVVHGPQMHGVLVKKVMGIGRLVNRHLFGLFYVVAATLDVFLNFGSERLIIDPGSLGR